MVGVGTPEVKGGTEAEEAPEKAGEPVVADGEGMTAVLLGFRTLLVIRIFRAELGGWKSILINNVDNTTGDQDIWNNYFGVVDEHGAILDCDGNIVALKRH